MRHDENKAGDKTGDAQIPLPAGDLDIENQIEEDTQGDTSDTSQIGIDIRLDQDLSEYDGQTVGARSNEIDLDFNLTSPGNKELSYIETKVLNINTTRSFSRQIDVNLEKLNMSGFVTPDKLNTVLSRTFRQLKRPLINNVKGKGATVLDNANLIMVTSSTENEGKTYSAINMAMSIAMEKDRRVLLIDADVAKPSHHNYFDVEMNDGLTDLLMDRVKDVSQIIYQTNIPSLSLMFAGTQTEHATELFASNAMEDFVDELSKRYDDRVIIFDSAPLLLTTEASVLASIMGQIIFVIEAEKTSHEMVKSSLGMLSNRIVLLLLNKMRGSNKLAGYGYYGKYEE